MTGWLNKIEMEQMYTTIEDILDNNDIKCICGDTLLGCNLRVSENYSVDHGKEFWIYASCSECKYDTNYEKILRQYNRFKTINNRFKEVN